MTQYALIMRRPAPSENPITSEIMAEMGPKWGQFLGGLSQSGALKGSYHTKYEGSVLTGTSAERADIDLGTDTVIGVMIIEAQDQPAAEAIAADVPTLAAWGGSVEVRPLEEPRN